LVAQSPHEGFTAACAKITARFLGKRVALVVESHGDFEVSLFLQRRVLYPSVHRFLIRQSARFALRHADVLRAISNSTRKQLEKWTSTKPIFQFATWTNMDVFLKAGGKRKRNLDEKMIIYAGVLIPRKGVHFLLDAFANIISEEPGSKLLIIGRSENREYAEMLKGKAARLNLGARVIFSDSLPQAVLADLMAQARVLVLPSLSEGLGRVIFEAMACGAPVIGSSIGGIMEMIVDGENGFLVPSEDVDSLTDRLRWVLKNPEKAYEMGKKGRKFAEAFFSTKGYVENYRQIIDVAGKHL
jgi:glycosyltransferase involved in cell wall biosynthesis